MGTNDLSIHLCNTPEEAPHYKSPRHKAATLDEAVVVRKGTEEGRPTIDLIFTTADGQKHVALITARLLRTLTDLTPSD